MQIALATFTRHTIRKAIAIVPIMSLGLLSACGGGGGSTPAPTTPAPTTPAPTTPAPKVLNDTGITLCGDYAYGTGSGTHNNDLDCSSGDPQGDPIPQGQDAMEGRDADVVTNDASDGHAGFSFTKIGTSGEELAATATDWTCVKDNVTNLIWEVKQGGNGNYGDEGLHDADDKYTWYNSDTTTNGGDAGYARQSDSSVNPPTDNSCSGYTDGVDASYCNTQAYVQRVNASNGGVGLCGATDWRMPTREELRSITHYGRYAPSVDNNYFSKTKSSGYWSSSPHASNSVFAWKLNFYNGYGGYDSKVYVNYVRLVRSGQ